MRSEHLRATSRICLCLYVAFSALCGVVWWFTTHSNRVDYSDYEREANEVCKGVEDLNGTFCSSIHISYVVGVQNLDEFRPTGVHINPSVKTRLSKFIDVTDSTQVLYDITNPIDDHVLHTTKLGNKIKWHLNPSPLHSEITMLMFVLGYPVTSDYDEVSCYYQSSWGGICVVQGSGSYEDHDTKVNFTASQKFLVPKVLQVVSRSSGVDAKKSKICTTYKTLFTLLNAFANLPVTADVVSLIASSLENFNSHPSVSLDHIISAYTSHHLVTSAYFPPDHLLAIYLPLFFPIVATVLIGIVWELKTSKKEKLELQQKKHK